MAAYSKLMLTTEQLCTAGWQQSMEIMACSYGDTKYRISSHKVPTIAGCVRENETIFPLGGFSAMELQGIHTVVQCII